ncbi:hypothetical protein ACWDR9_28395, partial [Streptosporangium sandarakinum]
MGSTPPRRARTYRYRRVYPRGTLYAPVTGYLSLYGSSGIE